MHMTVLVEKTKLDIDVQRLIYFFAGNPICICMVVSFYWALCANCVFVCV